MLMIWFVKQIERGKNQLRANPTKVHVLVIMIGHFKVKNVIFKCYKKSSLTMRLEEKKTKSLIRYCNQAAV